MIRRLGFLVLVLATTGGLMLSARALLGHPPSLPVAIGYLGGYLALVVLGITSPWLQMWGDILCSVPGARGVALTFEIHEVTRLEALLRSLQAYDAQATLFVPASLLPVATSLLREAAEAGHDLGLLAAPEDPWLFARSGAHIDEELTRGIEAFQEYLGARPWLLRSSGGRTSPRLVRAAFLRELTLVGWACPSAALADGVVLRVEETVRGTNIQRSAEKELWRKLSERNLKAVSITHLLGVS